jgi:hypothetical protein
MLQYRCSPKNLSTMDKKLFTEMSLDERKEWLAEFQPWYAEKLPVIESGKFSHKDFEQGLFLIAVFPFTRSFVREALRFRDYASRKRLLRNYSDKALSDAKAALAITVDLTDPAFIHPFHHLCVQRHKGCPHCLGYEKISVLCFEKDAVGFSLAHGERLFHKDVLIFLDAHDSVLIVICVGSSDIDEIYVISCRELGIVRIDLCIGAMCRRECFCLASLSCGYTGYLDLIMTFERICHLRSHFSASEHSNTQHIPKTSFQSIPKLQVIINFIGS